MLYTSMLLRVMWALLKLLVLFCIQLAGLHLFSVFGHLVHFNDTIVSLIVKVQAARKMEDDLPI